MSQLRVALRFGHGVSHNSGESGIPSTRTGSAKPYLVVKRILFLFGRAGLTTPTRLRFLFRLTLSVTFRRNGIHDFTTKCNGHRYCSDRPAWYQLHRASDANNLIITQKQLYCTKETVRTSGMVPGEHTVGQRWLTVQLVVGSQRTAF